MDLRTAVYKKSPLPLDKRTKEREIERERLQRKKNGHQ
jgi:hypothetical protein